MDGLPPDPFPDLTLVDLEQLKPTPQLAYLQVVRALFPGAAMVFMAEVIERTDQGAPHIVRIIP